MRTGPPSNLTPEQVLRLLQLLHEYQNPSTDGGRIGPPNPSVGQVASVADNVLTGGIGQIVANRLRGHKATGQEKIMLAMMAAGGGGGRMGGERGDFIIGAPFSPGRGELDRIMNQHMDRSIEDNSFSQWFKRNDNPAKHGFFESAALNSNPEITHVTNMPEFLNDQTGKRYVELGLSRDLGVRKPPGYPAVPPIAPRLPPVQSLSDQSLSGEAARKARPWAKDAPKPENRGPHNPLGPWAVPFDSRGYGLNVMNKLMGADPRGGTSRISIPRRSLIEHLIQNKNKIHATPDQIQMNYRHRNN